MKFYFIFYIFFLGLYEKRRERTKIVVVCAILSVINLLEHHFDAVGCYFDIIFIAELVIYL